MVVVDIINVILLALASINIIGGLMMIVFTDIDYYRCRKKQRKKEELEKWE